MTLDEYEHFINEQQKQFDDLKDSQDSRVIKHIKKVYEMEKKLINLAMAAKAMSKNKINSMDQGWMEYLIVCEHADGILSDEQ